MHVQLIENWPYFQKQNWSENTKRCGTALFPEHNHYPILNFSKMETQLRLNSVVKHSVGSGSESLAIDLIYEILLREYSENIYRYISINQIDLSLNEFVLIEPGGYFTQREQSFPLQIDHLQLCLFWRVMLRMFCDCKVRFY